MGIYKVAILVVQAYTVRIAIGSQAYFKFRCLRHGLRQFEQVLMDRLRRSTHEGRVIIAMQQYGRRQGLADHVLPGAIHGVVSHFIRGIVQFREVEFGVQVVDVHLFKIDVFEQSFGFPILEAYSRDGNFFGDQCFYSGNIGRAAGAAVGAFQLITIIRGRVMRCGNHHTLLGVFCFNAKRYHGRAHKAFGEQHFYAVVTQYLGGRFGKELAGKAAIMPDHHYGRLVRLFQPIGQALGYTGNVINGKVFCNNGTPSVCAKFNFVHKLIRF